MISDCYPSKYQMKDQHQFTRIYLGILLLSLLFMNLSVFYFTFLFATFSLVIFSIKDLKTSLLENDVIFILFFIGLILSLYQGNALAMLLATLLMAIFAYALWFFDTVGGADSKVLIALVPYLSLFNITNYFSAILIFTIVFGVVGCVFGGMYKLIYRKQEGVPFIPAITLAYIIYGIMAYFAT